MNHIEHRKLRKALEACLDGEADPSVAVAVRQHLHVCWVCSGDAEWLVLIKKALARIGERRGHELTVTRLARATSAVSRN